MPYKAAVLTVSDRSARGVREDTAGPAVIERLKQAGWEVVRYKIVPDESADIYATLVTWADLGMAHVILTVGGTGFGPRDITPEVTRRVIKREAPGLAEAMRRASLEKTPYAMLSRGVAGIRGHTLIVNLPGSPKAAVENLEVILPVLPHAVQLLLGERAAEEEHREMQQGMAADVHEHAHEDHHDHHAHEEAAEDAQEQP